MGPEIFVGGREVPRDEADLLLLFLVKVAGWLDGWMAGWREISRIMFDFPTGSAVWVDGVWCMGGDLR